MTASKELHEQVDRLSPEGVEQLRVFLERQAFADEQMRLLHEFAEGWTPEEEEAFEAAMNRRVPWRTQQSPQDEQS